MTPQILNFSSEIFSDMREKLDAAIKITVDQLIDKKLTAGTISAKIDITMMESRDKETGELLINPVIEPEVKIRIGAKGKLDCSPVGGMILKKGPCGENIVASNQVDIDELLKNLGDDEKGA